MKVQQLYTNCLAQGAYYIADGGEAAIIDPLRETRPYLEMLEQNGDRLKYIFETHFHADFVSGHVDLSKATGAQIVFGPMAKTEFRAHIARDNEEFRIGRLTLKVIHTPGHTLESACYLLHDADGKPVCVFTGDTLFIGDVGRPDLAVKSDLTQEDLAGMLYDSLRTRILPLPDDLVVYPAHGAGSACGKNMSKETFDSLGNQKKSNYALRDMSRQQFIREVTEGILPPPQYFAKNAALNKGGYDSYEEVVKRGLRPLGTDAFAGEMGKALVLDVRKPQEYAESHVPGSVFVGLDGQFAPWVGTVIPDLRTRILLVTPAGREEEAVMRLSRVGYDNCAGYLEGGVEAWKSSGKKTASVRSIDADTFMAEYGEENVTLDVRRPSEFSGGHLKKALSKPLDFIEDWLGVLDQHRPYLVHCAGGYRSMIAVSLMKRAGIENVTDVRGGYSSISRLPSAGKELAAESAGV